MTTKTLALCLATLLCALTTTGCGGALCRETPSGQVICDAPIDDADHTAVGSTQRRIVTCDQAQGTVTNETKNSTTTTQIDYGSCSDGTVCYSRESTTGESFMSCSNPDGLRR